MRQTPFFTFTKQIIAFITAVWISLLSTTALANSEQNAEQTTKQDGSQTYPFILGWSDLMPDGFKPEDLSKKYEKEINRLNELPDNSEEGLAILKQIQDEIDHIPTNPKWDGKWVKLPGFIAPLDTQNGVVSRFLLVPYFGACIHVPPPPINQTVLVHMKDKQGIKLHEIDYPFMATGKLKLNETKTDIGTAGYHLVETTVTIHHDSRWLEEEQ